MIVALTALVLFAAPFDEGDETAEVTVGRRLFFETRFAQYFRANSRGRINEPLTVGDPVLAGGPYAGRSMSCRTCHLVNENPKAVRTYTDFARRSPIPARGDGLKTTLRRTPILVNSTVPRAVPLFLHADGGFTTIEELVRGGWTGRNFGWLPDEAAAAVRHIADVVRQDDGTDLFARQTARLSYEVLLAGVDPKIPPFVRIPDGFRIDVRKAGDPAVLDAIAKLVGVYVDSLRFGVSRPDLGALYVGSPYDVFLVKNGLPRKPDATESAMAYARRLRATIGDLASPVWVSPSDWAFKFHDQKFKFGAKEFEGLKVFLSERVGNCISCHTPPAFTDFIFHNTGTAQEEHDAVHGAGAFAVLDIPSLSQRTEPRWRAFQDRTDLGVWNVFDNPAMPKPQSALRSVLGASTPPTDADLARTIALFKTPTVRDLGQTGPYFHTGRKDTIESVVRHYVQVSESAKAGRVRNGDPRLRQIVLCGADEEALVAFLRSLNEDYTD
jgi:cytochrome c peroxidase